MNLRIVALWSAALALALSFGAPLAGAQEPPTKVGFCNATKAIYQTQEYKDIQATTTNDQKAFETEANARNNKLKQQQADLQIYKPDSKEFKDLNEKLLTDAVTFEAWTNVMQRELARRQKQATREMFAKLDAAVLSIAKGRGYTIIVSDSHGEITEDQFEKAEPLQFSAILASRTVLFTDPRADITQDVVMAMNQVYGQKATTRP